VSGFLLDTNIPAEIIRTRPYPRVNAWILSQDDESLYLSVVTIGELRIRSNHSAREQAAPPPSGMDGARPPATLHGQDFTSHPGNCRSVGILSGQRQIAGRLLSMADGLIAATALEHSLVLVTRNVKDCEELGVTILNPWESL
jgi:predicted nucleic acid-binding protein